MTLPISPMPWADMSPCEHFVQFYDTDPMLLDLLQDYVADGLRDGEAVIVIATHAHLAALDRRLQDDGFDVVAARWQGQYLPMDARATLAQFMIGDTPDVTLFKRTLHGVLARARRTDRQVRAFGEMVSLLLDEGLPDAVLHLERLWNDFCRRESVPLFCAYPRAAFTAGTDATFGAICRSHSRLITA